MLLGNMQPYRALVSSLLYLTITGLDFVFSVGLVSKFMQSPRKPHLETAKKILKYVNSTLNMGLFFKKKVTFSLVGFIDTDRRSIPRYVFLNGSTSISWCCKKQNSIFLSTTKISLSTSKTEYKAAARAVQDAFDFKNLRFTLSYN